MNEKKPVSVIEEYNKLVKKIDKQDEKKRQKIKKAFQNLKKYVEVSVFISKGYKLIEEEGSLSNFPVCLKKKLINYKEDEIDNYLIFEKAIEFLKEQKKKNFFQDYSADAVFLYCSGGRTVQGLTEKILKDFGCKKK
ncbi:MAG: hypothetical protein KAI16_00825 [Candidatus Pacebacteria bacterium]|nr:hypothetical protein [Candidatus Paceibacterota bacterium]